MNGLYGFQKGILAGRRFRVPLSLRERAGVRGTRCDVGFSNSQSSPASPHPNPLPEGEGDLAGRAASVRSPGFTLIELLVVIVIIAMLAGLITVAAVRARQRAKNLAMKTEVTLLSQAMDAYKEKMGEYPPDFGYFADPTGAQLNAVRAHIARAFPQCLPQYNPADNVNCTYPYLVTALTAGAAVPMGPNVALRFWLGGPAGNGFSADPQDPFDIKTFSQGLPPQPSRIGPFFDFDVSRVATANTSIYSTLAVTSGSLTLFLAAEYFPDNGWAIEQSNVLNTLTNNSPYLYFAARNGSYNYLTSSGATNVTTYVYPRRPAPCRSPATCA